ncbi:tRNA 2-thiocytidine biosynthesis TtcA family protein [Lachnospiraceae bacterium 62-35]
MNLQRLMSLTRQAIDKYHMIDKGDHIAVGISGGKDSLALLYALHGLMKFYPNNFSLIAITVDLGLENMSLGPIKTLCEQFLIPYTVISTEIGEILFERRKESSPCSLCAKMRKGALNEYAKKAGCNKVAYAHHREDLIETMMMSLIYEGRFHAFSPYTYLDRMDLTVIRPMIFVPEADVIGFQHSYALPVCKNPCPMDGHTKREYVKLLIKQLERENPGLKSRLFHAVTTGNISGWPREDTAFSG